MVNKQNKVEELLKPLEQIKSDKINFRGINLYTYFSKVINWEKLKIIESNNEKILKIENNNLNNLDIRLNELYNKIKKNSKNNYDYQYLNNIDKIIEFFKTNEYKILKNNYFNKDTKIINKAGIHFIFVYIIQNIINNGNIDDKKIYEDPDTTNDENLYTYFNNMLNNDKYKMSKKKNKPCIAYESGDNEEIILSLDGIAWKQLLKICYEEAKKDNETESFEENFIKLYAIVRKVENGGHLLWPKYGTSINMVRYSAFKDRIDHTLLDIKKFFKETNIEEINAKKGNYKLLKEYLEEQGLKLASAYANKNTNKWLSHFREGNDANKSFRNFIEEMNLRKWCILDGEECKVINLTPLENNDSGLNVKNFLYAIENHKKINFTIEEMKKLKEELVLEEYSKQSEVNKQYIENVIHIITNNPDEDNYFA